MRLLTIEASGEIAGGKFAIKHSFELEDDVSGPLGEILTEAGAVASEDGTETWDKSVDGSIPISQPIEGLPFGIKDTIHAVIEAAAEAKIVLGPETPASA